MVDYALAVIVVVVAVVVVVGGVVVVAFTVPCDWKLHGRLRACCYC